MLSADVSAPTAPSTRPSSGSPGNVVPEMARSGGRQARTQDRKCASGTSRSEDAAWRSSGSAISGATFAGGPLGQVEFSSAHGGRLPLGAGAERRIPLTYRAAMSERRPGEPDGLAVGVVSGTDVGPVEDILAKRRLPTCRRRLQHAVSETVGRGVRVGVEGGAVVALVTGPP